MVIDELNEIFVRTMIKTGTGEHISWNTDGPFIRWITDIRTLILDELDYDIDVFIN